MSETYLDRFFSDLELRYAGQNEFLQAVRELDNDCLSTRILMEPDGFVPQYDTNTSSMLAKSCVSLFQAESSPATAPAPNHRLRSFGCAESWRFQLRLPHPSADSNIPFLSLLLSGSGFIK